MTWVSFFCVWPLPIPTYVSVLSYYLYLCYKRDGPPACNKTPWPHQQKERIRTSFKQKWPSPSLIPSHHSLDLVTRHLLLRPSTPLEILHERFPASVAHGTHPTHPRQLYHRTVAAPLFCFAQSAPFQLDRKALVIFLPWHFGGMLGEEILCDLPSHIVLRHKSKPKFGISIKPVLYRVAFQSFTIPSSLSLASPGNGLLNVASPESPLPLPWQTPKASIHLLVPAGVLTSRKWWGPDCFTAHLIWFPSVFASIHIKPIENCSKNTPRNKNSSRPIKRH